MKFTIKNLLVISCVFLFSCSEEKQENVNSPINQSQLADVEISREVLEEMMQSLPQPIEIAQIISSSKTDMNKDVLIPSDKADKYEDKYIQSLAFGAYGVDLGYINLNNKTLYVMEYLGSIRILADKLNVKQFFDFATLSELAKNRNSSDSLIRLSTGNFNKIDEFLREHNRGELSALILIGAWMEGMNMFCEIYKNTKSDDITKRLGEQKVLFDNVYLLLGKLNKIGFYRQLERDFAGLKLHYEKIKISYDYKEPLMQEVNGQLVLKDQTETKIDFTMQDIDNIVKEFQSIRNSYFIIK
jgi:hypothetical protein